MHAQVQSATVARTATILLASVFFVVGVTKFLAGRPWVELFGHWGYRDGFSYFIGVLEILGASLLISPRTRFVGAALLGWIMIGAIFTHVASGEFLTAILPIMLLAPLVALAWHSVPAGQDHAPWEHPMHSIDAETQPAEERAFVSPDLPTKKLRPGKSPARHASS